MTISKHSSPLCTVITNDGEERLVKVVRQGRHEANITKRLLELVSGQQRKSTPFLVDMILRDVPTRPDLTIIQMPDGGVRITGYKRLHSDLFGLTIQLLNGVSFLHEHGIAHLDLKPDNILVTSTGKLNIIDFSISVFAEKDTKMKRLVGTYGFMAPEVLQDEEYAVFPVDVYGTGRVIEEMTSKSRGIASYMLNKLVTRLKSKLPVERLTAKQTADALQWGYAGLATLLLHT